MSLIKRDLAIRAIAEDMLEMAITENPDTGDTVEDWILTAESILSGVPDAEPEIIHCKDCKHRPKATRADEKVFYGFSVKFPDEKCPCYCEDGWYGWYPEDDFYCGYAERREE